MVASALSTLLRNRKRGYFLIFQLPQNELQLWNFFLIQFAHQDRRIHGRQRSTHSCYEFDGAGAIDKGIAVAHEIGGGEARLQRSPVTGAPLCWRPPTVFPASTVPWRGIVPVRVRICFEQRRLAALERAHQRNAPWTRGSCAVLCHIPLPENFEPGLFTETVSRHGFRT